MQRHRAAIYARENFFFFGAQLLLYCNRNRFGQSHCLHK
jgi:hypothetical protein